MKNKSEDMYCGAGDPFPEFKGDIERKRKIRVAERNQVLKDIGLIILCVLIIFGLISFPAIMGLLARNEAIHEKQ